MAPRGRLTIPPALRRNVAGAWGAAGERWLAGLPRLAASVARDWELALGAPFGLSYHWVAAARRTDGSQAVQDGGARRTRALDVALRLAPLAP